MKAAIVLCFALGMCAAAVKPTTIPPGAVETGPAMYSYTDRDGVHWLLRKTPFGVAAVEEKEEGTIKAFDAGDSVRFVKTTPFGSNTWTRKKSALTESEREIWQRQSDRDGVK